MDRTARPAASRQENSPARRLYRASTEAHRQGVAEAPLRNAVGYVALGAAVGAAGALIYEIIVHIRDRHRGPKQLNLKPGVEEVKIVSGPDDFSVEPAEVLAEERTSPLDFETQVAKTLEEAPKPEDTPS